MSWLGQILGITDFSEFEGGRISFGAPWVQDRLWLLVLLCGIASTAGVLWYVYLQNGPWTKAKTLLAALRGTVLSLVVLILAEPILELKFVSSPKPWLWVLLDGSESMAIQDEAEVNDTSSSSSDRPAADGSASSGSAASGNSAGATRADQVRNIFQEEAQASLKALSEKFRIRLFSMVDSQGVRVLSAEQETGEGSSREANNPAKTTRDPEAQYSVEALLKSLGGWQTKGDVSAHGAALDDLARRHATDHLAGVVVISDFDQNSGPYAVASAKRLGAPIFAVGVGPVSARDLSVDLLVPPTMKKAETSTISVTVRQRESLGENVTVKLSVHPAGAESQSKLVGSRQVNLSAASLPVEFPYLPDQAGRMVFVAEVESIPGESVTENNRVTRDVTVIDDFLRLMFVEYEPTWEWRFIKEVFHRDRLVGMRGFRTYLRSADPVVRETNDLFLPSLTLPRNEFFQTDVIFLGDMPASALTTRFCELTREFVGQFGGGLVVMAGPRFGPGELAQTPLADMLPVVVDPDGRIDDREEFAMSLTPLASQFDFMRLGESADEQRRAWANLAKVPWYQPVVRVEPRSTTVLAEHPTAVCADGKTKQPLIAIRKYGRGEVVYIAHNEMWRLRRLYGETYYRQFWGQLIHRLGLSHAIGSQKRFVVRTDKTRYRADEKVVVTVEAYDQNFNPLGADQIPEGRLSGELSAVDTPGAEPQRIAIPALRPGVFETRMQMTSGGEHQLSIFDPLEKQPVTTSFTVASASAERRSAVRNEALQTSLATETGGKSYSLNQFAQLAKDIKSPEFKARQVVILPLWATWLCFGLVVGLLSIEWALRKGTNLP
ncbi:MAG: hypothetical protein C0478_07995 [Planctomyces sp.]|nr:hypothetical protein [Planctomyces sp.]